MLACKYAFWVCHNHRIEGGRREGRVGEAQARILKDTSCQIWFRYIFYYIHTLTHTHILTAARPGRRCGPSSSILSFASCAPSIFRTLLQLHPRSPSNPDSHVSCPFLPPRVIKSKIRLLSQLLNQLIHHRRLDASWTLTTVRVVTLI